MNEAPPLRITLKFRAVFFPLIISDFSGGSRENAHPILPNDACILTCKIQTFAFYA
jgi:hypothetical protein